MLRCFWFSKTKSQMSQLTLVSEVGDILLPFGDDVQVEGQEREFTCVARCCLVVGDLGLGENCTAGSDCDDKDGDRAVLLIRFCSSLSSTSMANEWLNRCIVNLSNPKSISLHIGQISGRFVTLTKLIFNASILSKFGLQHRGQGNTWAEHIAIDQITDILCVVTIFHNFPFDPTRTETTFQLSTRPR